MGAAPAPEERALRRLAGGMREMAPVFENAIYEEMRQRPTYARLNTEQVRPVVRRHIHAFIDHFAEAARTMSAADHQFFRSMGEQRARQGVAIDDLVHIWRLLIKLMRDYVAAQPDLHEDGALIVAFQAIDQLDTGLLDLIAGYQTVEVGQEPTWLRVVDSSVLQTVTEPGHPVSKVLAALAKHGFEGHNLFHVARARPVGEEDRAQILRWITDFPGPMLCGLIDGDVCAISAAPLKVDQDRALGVAGPVAATDLPKGIRLALRSLEVALQLGHRGPQSLERLGVETAVVADLDVGDALVKTYVAPVLEQTTAGEAILDTVEEFLRQDLKLAPTAAHLHLHLNTVRYRLAKFEQVTSANIRHVEQLVEIWWALKRRHLP